MDKIRRIFPLLILFTLLSCADTIETRIPYRAVYLELDLTYQDKALKHNRLSEQTTKTIRSTACHTCISASQFDQKSK